LRRVLTSAAAGTVAALAVTACSGGASSTNASPGGTPGNGASGGQQYASGKTLTMTLPSDPGTLDPDLTALSVAIQADYFLYDPLVNIQPDGTLVSGLATAWTGNTTSATFTVRKGVTCSDGAQLTASDVAANINFIGNPKNASPKIGIWVPPTATATGDDSTGVVTVKSPVPDAFLVRNVGQTQIVCGAGMKNRATLKTGASGTGEYTLTSAVPGSSYTLTLRKDYAWGPGGASATAPGTPAQVVLKVVNNMTTAANLLQAGQANIAEVLGPDMARLKALKLAEQDVLAPYGELWFNEKKGMPGADLAVRTALTRALQLDQLAQVFASGTGSPATGLVAPGLSPCKGNTVGSSLPGYDVTAAKAALAAAGWKPGPDGILAKGGTKLAIALYYPTSIGGGSAAGAQFAQQAWSALGVQVTLKPITSGQLSTDIVGGQAAWGAGFIPLGLTLPSQVIPFVSGPTPPKGTNFASISNAAYSADVAKASATAGTEGCPSWNAAETALFKNLDLVPFVDSTVPWFARGATFSLSQGSVVPTSVKMLG
jgi:peptide/nickel transport system substrate-binding protein